jgi:hypothetical protein
MVRPLLARRPAPFLVPANFRETPTPEAPRTPFLEDKDTRGIG